MSGETECIHKGKELRVGLVFKDNDRATQPIASFIHCPGCGQRWFFSSPDHAAASEVADVVQALKDAGLRPEGFNELMRQSTEANKFWEDKYHAAASALATATEALERAKKLLRVAWPYCKHTIDGEAVHYFLADQAATALAKLQEQEAANG